MAAAVGVELPPGRCGVGVRYLPNDPERRVVLEQLTEDTIEGEGSARSGGAMCPSTRATWGKRPDCRHRSGQALISEHAARTGSLVARNVLTPGSAATASAS